MAEPLRTAASYTITELAQEFDITPRAIRFYEDVGLLTPARAGRNRVYTQRDRTRLKLTLRGKRLGLSLSEIKQLVDMYDSPSDTQQQLTAFLAVLAEHRRLLEQQREDLEITLAEIAQHEERCRCCWPARPRARRPAAAARSPSASIDVDVNVNQETSIKPTRPTAPGDARHEPARPELHARRRHRRAARRRARLCRRRDRATRRRHRPQRPVPDGPVAQDGRARRARHHRARAVRRRQHGLPGAHGGDGGDQPRQRQRRPVLRRAQQPVREPDQAQRHRRAAREVPAEAGQRRTRRRARDERARRRQRRHQHEADAPRTRAASTCSTAPRCGSPTAPTPT